MIKSFDLIKCPTCTKDMTIFELSAHLKEKASKEAVVLEKSKPAGVITLTDIVYRCIAQGKDPKKTHVEDIYTKDVFFLDEGEDEKKAFFYMVGAGHLFCPITSKGKFIGLLPLSHLFKRKPKK